MIYSILFHDFAMQMTHIKYLRKMCTSKLPKVPDLFFKNPVLDLQKYMEVPLFREEDICYEPTTEEMNLSLQIFEPYKKKIKLISNTIQPERFPSHDLPEVALLGRSNAGKTSLLEAIFHAMPELRIQSSRRPGHTKSLKFYKVGSHLCIVDMPGYGYRSPIWFKDSVIPYLKKRRNLVKTFLLVDIQENFHAWDDASLEMLKDLGVPFAVVLTKIDKVTDSVRLRNLLFLRKIINEFTYESNTCFPQVFMLSSKTFEGLPYFLSFIAHITGTLNAGIPNKSVYDEPRLN